MHVICLMTQFHVFSFPRINSFACFLQMGVIFNNPRVAGLEAEGGRQFEEGRTQQAQRAGGLATPGFWQDVALALWEEVPGRGPKAGWCRGSWAERLQLLVPFSDGVWLGRGWAGHCGEP